MRTIKLIVVLCLAAVLSACSMPQVPGMPDLGRLTDIPGVPRELADMPELLQDLGLGELVDVDNLPGVDTLPFLRTQPGVLALRGPIEQRINVGERIPGTDIVLTGINEDGGVFEIAGMRSTRTYADSLDFDGAWPNVDGVQYSLRLRLYHIGRDSVRAAGVHQVEIRDIAPQPLDQLSSLGQRTELSFLATWGMGLGEQIPGTTLRYVGQDDRGAEIGPVDDGMYPYHKVGDSVRWRGQLRPNIEVDYHLRMLSFGENSSRVGGIVNVRLPSAN